MNCWRYITAAGFLLLSINAVKAAKVGAIDIDGTINPATAGYISRAITEAARQQDECLIVRLDTPGGLLDSTKEIVQAIFASPLPITVFVAPAGATATSAGVFITMASDVAAMAPGTSIGAAHPVTMEGPTGGDAKPDDVMKNKIENYAASYIESIAQKRQRNVEWARDAVRNSASITAEKALDLKVIEILAQDMPDLLKQLDGRRVGDRTLKTASAEVVRIPMNLREHVFQLIWRPEVMFVLMLVALYGIIGELSNPGAILPGVAGLVAFILVLYMSSVLPVNIAGLALIGLAVALFVVDVFAPTHGVLTFGGIAAFLLGSFMLFDDPAGVLRLSWTLIVPAAITTAAFFAFVVGAGLRAQLLPVKAGTSTMLGKTIQALTPIDARSGRVFVEGEYWSATSDTLVEAGEPVEIIGLRGLTLQVKPTPKET
jgi:membrane-bound serine protease (ClpP class)